MMQQFFTALPDWLGTIPQWISAGGVVGVLYIVAHVYLGKSQLGIKSQQVHLEGEKIEIEGDAKLREHFAEELKRLTAQIKSAEERVDRAEDRQRKCEQREERLRRRVAHLEDEVTGLHRIIAFNSSALLLASDGRPSEAVREASIAVLEKLAKGEALAQEEANDRGNGQGNK